MNNLKCKDCAYCWSEENEKYPTCHYWDWRFLPPCEEEEESSNGEWDG